MLKEEIHYKNGFPINILINGIKEYPSHYHDGIEIICVLDGSIRIQDSCFSCCLTQGDVYIFNDADLHSMHSISSSNIILFMHIDLDYYTNIIKGIDKVIFMCDSYIKKGEIENELAHLRYLLMKISEAYHRDNLPFDYYLNYYTKSLLSFMMEHFTYFLYEKNLINSVDFKSQKKYKVRNEQMQRIHRITDYIYEHSHENITLNDISQLEYLNTFYLSHLIKNTCGLSFTEVLSLARVEAAEKLLLDTNKNVEVIASETGFTSRKYLNIHFKKWYKMTPSAYRKKYKAGERSNKYAVKYIGYNKEKAKDKVHEYLYNNDGNNKLTSLFENESNNTKPDKVTDFAKLLYVSGQVYTCMSKNNNHSSYEEWLDLFNASFEESESYKAYIIDILTHMNNDLIDKKNKAVLLKILNKA